MKNKTYIIAAGGTSGHINPAIAIAEKIRKSEPDARILFCGTKKGMENTVVPNHHFEMVHIDAEGFPTKPTLRLFTALSTFFRGRAQSRKLLAEMKPVAVIGTGGYVCGPMVSMASSLGIPTLLHEQNAFPGKANRFLARKASVVCISFPGTEKFFQKAHSVVMTGNPVREAFYNINKDQARSALGIAGDEKILFVTGGSLGAGNINRNIMELLKNHPDPGFHIILACGRIAYPTLLEESKLMNSPFLDLKEYLFDQHLYLAAADVVLCRAGALTCSEIAMLGKASIMIPYPYAAGDHQTYNARTFSDIGASILIPDFDLIPENLYEKLCMMFSDQAMTARMGMLAQSLSMPEATRQIYDELVRIVRERDVE